MGLYALAAQMASFSSGGGGGGRGGGRGRSGGRGKASSPKTAGVASKGGYLPFTAELYRKMNNGEISQKDAYYRLLDEVDKGNISQSDFDKAMKSSGISNATEEAILQKVASENMMNNYFSMKYPLLGRQMQSQSNGRKNNNKGKNKGGQSGRIRHA